MGYLVSMLPGLILLQAMMPREGPAWTPQVARQGWDLLPQLPVPGWCGVLSRHPLHLLSLAAGSPPCPGR